MVQQYVKPTAPGVGSKGKALASYSSGFADTIESVRRKPYGKLIAKKSRRKTPQQRSQVSRAKPSTEKADDWFNELLTGNKTTSDVYLQIQGGVDARTLRQFFQQLGSIPRELLVRSVGLSLRTMDRALEEKKVLNADTTDRAARLAEAVALAESVFGDKDAATQWWLRPNTPLGKQVPIVMMQTATGGDLVKQYLRRVEYGVYA